MPKSIVMNYAILLTYLFFYIPAVGNAAVVEFETAARVGEMDSDKLTTFTAGQRLDLKDGQAYVVIPEGQLPWLFFNPSNRNSKIKLSSTKNEALYQNLMQPVLDRQLNEILNEINRVQAMIQKRDYSNAVTHARQLKEKYPRLATVYFLSGTANFAANNKSGASEDFKKGLEIDPNNDWAKSLQEKLQKGER